MSSRKVVHAIVYIPGLGDHRVKGQLKAVRAWQTQGVEPHLFQMNWQDGERLEPKLQRLLALVDKLHKQGKTVSLIAASAGASAAMHILAARPNVINGVVSICGKLSGKENVHPSLYSRNPAFHESMHELHHNTDALDAATRRRIMSMRALADESVPARDTMLQGIHCRRMPVVGHFFGIAYGLTIGSFQAIRFLKRLPPTQR